MIAAIEHFRSPDEALELVILQRDIAEFEIQAGEAALALGKFDAAAVFRFWIDQSGNAGLELPVGRQIKLRGEPPKVVHLPEMTEMPGVVGIISELIAQPKGQTGVVSGR